VVAGPLQLPMFFVDSGICSTMLRLLQHDNVEMNDLLNYNSRFTSNRRRGLTGTPF